jgi:folate-binding protein YgfZ
MDAAAGTAGYRGLRESSAWMDLSARGKLRATGEDRARLLHALTTQQVERMVPGDGCYAFFLNAQGRILGDANLFCLQDSLLLDTEPETRQKLFEHIDRYIIADDVTIEDATDRLATLAIEGPESSAVLAKLGAPVPEADGASQSWGERIVARVTSTGAGGYSVFLPVEEKPAFMAALTAAGVPQAAPQEARIVRLEHGHPRYGEEITERYLVQETGQLQAVNFTKGCYLGQEIVERVRSRAQIHRVLRQLQIDAATPPEPGAKLQSAAGAATGTGEPAEAGEIASAAFSPALGKVVAMAYVRTPFAEPDSALQLGDARVRVI